VPFKDIGPEVLEFGISKIEIYIIRAFVAIS
jgi:hypothetical protein